MAIEVKLDLMLVKRKMKLTELSERIGISVTNLSLLKTGRVKGMRFSTLGLRTNPKRSCGMMRDTCSMIRLARTS